MGTAGALYVLRSVTDNAREVFELIANRQLLLSERKVENSGTFESNLDDSEKFVFLYMYSAS